MFYNVFTIRAFDKGKEKKMLQADRPHVPK